VGRVEKDTATEVVTCLEFEIFLPFGVFELLVEGGFFGSFDFVGSLGAD